MIDRLKSFLKQLFSTPKPKVYAEVKNWPEGWEHHPPPKPVQLPSKPVIITKRPTLHVSRVVRPKEATSQEISKFMKHGHQAPWYRKSVKAKIQPEDEEK